MITGTVAGNLALGLTGRMWLASLVTGAKSLGLLACFVVLGEEQILADVLGVVVLVPLAQPLGSSGSTYSPEGAVVRMLQHANAGRSNFAVTLHWLLSYNLA